MIPLAVGRTAVAVRGLPDSGLMVGLTRGRAWIGVLSVLLAGIVALNVVSLSLSASQGRISQQTQVLEQENSALRARLALRLSNDRVQNAAASLGMAVPEPGEIGYRDASPEAVRMAVRRLAEGFGLGGGLVEEVPELTPTTTETVAAAPTDTAPAETAPPPDTTAALPSSPTTPAAPTQPAPSGGATTAGGGISPG